MADETVPATEDAARPDEHDDDLEGQPSEKLLRALRSERTAAREAAREEVDLG